MPFGDHPRLWVRTDPIRVNDGVIDQVQAWVEKGYHKEKLFHFKATRMAGPVF